MHRIHTLKKIIGETPDTRTYIFKGRISCSPGQFIMLWLPGIDEKPFAVSYLEKNEFGVTIEEKGRFTKELSKMREGVKLGVRGPYGNGFEIKHNSIIVAGGLGMAPALPLIRKIKDSIIIQGAKSRDYLLYLKDKALAKAVQKNNNKIIYCTDDGSFGARSFTTDVLKDVILKRAIARKSAGSSKDDIINDTISSNNPGNKLDKNNDNKLDKNKKDAKDAGREEGIVYTCGPEIMMRKVFGICEENKIECQASLERMIKCSIGLCGSCVCGDQLICRDGPVFKSEQLRKMGDFGRFARLKSGKKVPLREYFGYKTK